MARKYGWYDWCSRQVRISVIDFLQVEGNSAAEIHHRMSQVYGENFLSHDVVREWWRKFKDCWTDVHKERGQGRMSVATEDLVQQFNQVVRNKRTFTVSEFCVEFPEMLRSYLFWIVTNVIDHPTSLMATFFEEGIKSSSSDMTNASIFTAII